MKCKISLASSCLSLRVKRGNLYFAPTYRDCFVAIAPRNDISAEEI